MSKIITREDLEKFVDTQIKLHGEFVASIGETAKKFHTEMCGDDAKCETDFLRAFSQLMQDKLLTAEMGHTNIPVRPNLRVVRLSDLI